MTTTRKMLEIIQEANDSNKLQVSESKKRIDELIEEVKALKIIKNYDHLYDVLDIIPEAVYESICQVWQLLCLSGEPAAIDFIAKHEKIYESDQIKGIWTAILHYAALSGVPEQLEKALSLHIPFDALLGKYNILHFAASSGSEKQVKKVHELEKEYGIVLAREAPKGRNVAYFAHLTGFSYSYLTKPCSQETETTPRLKSY